jgi:hypothetical protein
MGRRLVVAVIVLLLFGLAVSWHTREATTPESRRLAGTWRKFEGFDRPDQLVRFTADGRYENWLDKGSQIQFDDPGTQARRVQGVWYFDGGKLVIDLEPNPVRRALRPVGRSLHVRAGVANRYSIEVTSDRLVMTDESRSRTTTTWVRDAP